MLKEPVPFAQNTGEEPKNFLTEIADISQRNASGIVKTGRQIVGEKLNPGKVHDYNEELLKMRRAKQEKDKQQVNWKADMLFPSTTNQEYTNAE